MSDTRQHLLDNVLGIVEEIENSNDPYEWLNEQLNIEAVMRDTSGNFLGAEVLCCCGGPDIRVDTRWGTVEGNWGGDHISRSVNCDELNDAIEQMF